MKILQLDVESIEYEPVEPEIKVHDKAERKSTRISGALALFVSVERGDTDAYASKAVKDAVDFAKKQKIANMVIYPFAHISDDLEEPQRAMNLLDYMAKEAGKSKLQVHKAPFGWNKRLSFATRGHPLAETLKSYGAAEKSKGAPKQRKYDVSLVRKADWAGLPENDHRSIAERMDLFSFQEVSPGMVYWHPKGFIIFDELVKYIKETLNNYGYQVIAAPSMADTALWSVSGHIDHFRENMFIFEANDHELGMKPMGCPFAMMIYKSRSRSYRELPMRLADFDRLYRNEISGALSGLFRVRELTQDDAHIFVTEEQIEEELVVLLKLVHEFYSRFGLDYKPKLSTMPDSHLGTEEMWEKATDALKKALKRNGMKYEVKEKEGAFYGPKIDYDIKDSLGREWQCATVQLDYQLPQRFGLRYAGEDGKEHTPVVIHRVIYGSLERFLGVLIEHLNGRFPTWLSPVQARVITVSEQANKYAYELYDRLRKEGIRVDADASDKTIEYKIREAQMQKIPYMIVLGKKEAESKKVSVRSRSGKQRMGIGADEFISMIKKEISERSSDQPF
ncbi:MAG: threonine--tRNA ligase [Candidatus Marsarchaeota archaeon]|jgi:threonyl-tRNA synthetase|nr:threonine--tRNA ligase [Candidatus Marsarchaeota archaeon]MCL5111769.1 threonine--tRNA ligase [Candidatus Marsarchaeota archaeon]